MLTDQALRDRITVRVTYAPDERQRTFQLDAGDLEVLDVRYDLHNL